MKNYNELMKIWIPFRDFRFENTKDEKLHSEYKDAIGRLILYSSIEVASIELRKAYILLSDKIV